MGMCGDPAVEVGAGRKDPHWVSEGISCSLPKLEKHGLDLCSQGEQVQYCISSLPLPSSSRHFCLLASAHGGFCARADHSLFLTY